MSDPNAFVSNGTCYTASGEKLDGSFVPCGNDAFGHQTCCGAGDNCLADNACFGVHGAGYGSYLTYWAGCTDPTYEAATCPKKEIDQPWVALTLCDDSNGEWAICSQSGDPATLQAGSFCSCTNAASATVAFSDANTLTSICSLPKSTGESIQFFVGHFPSSSLASAPAATNSATTTGANTSQSISQSSNTATATSGSGSSSAASSTDSNTTSNTQTQSSSGTTAPATTSGATTSGASTTSSTNTPAAGSGGVSAGNAHSGLSTGAKIGIGVGAGLGALALLGIILAILLMRRKRRRRPKYASGGFTEDPKPYVPPEEPPLSVEPERKTTPPLPAAHDSKGSLLPEADGQPVGPWAMRSELEGSRVPRHTYDPPMAELPGSESFAGEQGGVNTLAQEARRQVGPGWKGPSFKLLNSGGGKEHIQPTS